MLDIIVKRLSEYNYPEHAKSVIIDCAKKLDRPTFKQIIIPYNKDFDVDVSDMVAKAQIVANDVGVNGFTANLVLFLAMSESLRKHYVKQGLPLDSFDGVMLDLTYKAEECFLVQGVWGTFVSGWHVGFYKLKRFCFDRLQFESIPFKTLYHNNQSTALPPDTLVINVHIPRSKQRLDRDLINSSYARAYEFYKERLKNEQIVFACESWLLYPKNLEVLSEKSNLRHFIGDYQIIHSETYPDYKELWRLFDVNYDGNPDHLPQDTSLRRAYVNWLKQGLPIGFGVGIYRYEKGNLSIL